MKTVKRCSWPGEDKLMIEYHDKEWGNPCHDDKLHFEYLLLDTFQAGLSWRTILYKRENFRRAFSDFDYKKIAGYGKMEVKILLKDKGIVRNRLKIESAIENAKRFMEAKEEFGSFDKYIWGFVGGKTIVNKHKRLSDLGATSKESDAMSGDMKKRGFKFVGSTVCYAYMQGAGLVNDHLVGCFRRNRRRRMV